MVSTPPSRKNESLRQRLKHTLHLGRAFRFVWQSSRIWVIINLLLLLVQSILPLLQLYLLKLMVDGVAEVLSSSESETSFKQIAVFIGLMGGVSLIMFLCRSLALWVNEAQALTVTDYIQDILHAKSVEVDLEYYENPQYFDTLHRAQQEAPFRPTRIVNGLATLFQNSISLLVIAFLLISFHWSVALILFLAALPGLFVRMRYAGRMYRWQRDRTPTERSSQYYHFLLTLDQFAKEVRLFDLGSLLMRRFRKIRKLLRRERLQITKRRSIADAVAQTSSTIAVFLSYLFIAYRTVQGVITLGDLVMYFQAFQRAQTFLQQAMSALSGLYEDNLFLSHLSEFLDLKPKVQESRSSRPCPRPIRKGIQIDNVSFQYPTGARKVLENITMTLKPGEHIALVGENGSGKTTLVKLLCRLYDPTSGKVMLDDIDLREYESSTLRREMSVILQDYVQYHLTARENIWFGNIGLNPEDERIAAAAQQSGVDEVINGLPRGYDTVLGKWFEHGEELSIGEWQKMALARAFLRDAQIIILDEPTSSMDAKGEYEVFLNFSQLARDRTTILISHRLSTVRMADCIYVLDGGRIVEKGSHDELIRRDGKYRHLFEIQARNYK